MKAKSDPSQKGLVFVSYSHKNSDEKDELLLQLEVLQRDGLITVWNDQLIEAGTNWREEIHSALNAAKVAVFLVSAHFLTSRFILNEEVPPCLERSERGELRIMPILLHECLWQRVSWLSSMQVRPTDPRPLASGEKHLQVRAWRIICDEIVDWLDDTEPPEEPTGVSNPGDPPPLASAPLNSPASNISLGNSEPVNRSVTQLCSVASEIPEFQICLAGLKSQLNAFTNLAETAADLKETHDLLHSFEFQCFPRLIALERASDELDLNELELCIIDAEATLNHLRAIFDRSRSQRDQSRWITHFESALFNLQSELEETTRRSLKKACTLFRRILSIEPARINEELRRIAGGVDFQPIREALLNAKRWLTRSEGNIDRVASITDGLAALDDLKLQIEKLVAEHDQWQELETDLRLISSSLHSEISLQRGIEELDVLWPRIQENTLRITSNHNENWAERINTQTIRLAEAIGDQTPSGAPKIAPTFRAFRRLAAERFYQVDANLRRSLGKLGRIGDSLIYVLATALK